MQTGVSKNYTEENEGGKELHGEKE